MTRNVKWLAPNTSIGCTKQSENGLLRNDQAFKWLRIRYCRYAAIVKPHLWFRPVEKTVSEVLSMQVQGLMQGISYMQRTKDSYATSIGAVEYR